MGSGSYRKDQLMEEESESNVKTVIHFVGTENTVTVDMDFVSELAERGSVFEYEAFNNGFIVNTKNVTFMERVER